MKARDLNLVNFNMINHYFGLGPRQPRQQSVATNLDLFMVRKTVEQEGHDLLQEHLKKQGFSHRHTNNDHQINELKEKIKEMKNKYEIRMQVKLEEAKHEFDKEKTIRRLTQIMYKQESEIEKEYRIFERLKKEQQEEKRLKTQLYQSVKSKDPDKAELEDYIYKIGSEVESLYFQTENYQSQLESLKHISEDCIKNADNYRLMYEDALKSEAKMANSLSEFKQSEQQRHLKMNDHFVKEKEELEHQVESMRRDIQLEMHLKDVLIDKLRKKNERLLTEIRQAIHIMKIPRLMDIAQKRLNYDKIEITKYLPSEKTQNQQQEIEPGETFTNEHLQNLLQNKFQMNSSTRNYTDNFINLASKRYNLPQQKHRPHTSMQYRKYNLNHSNSYKIRGKALIYYQIRGEVKPIVLYGNNQLQKVKYIVKVQLKQ
eukprot:403344234